jgi:hypothetical protein
MLYLDKPGIGLATRAGRLVVKSSFASPVSDKASGKTGGRHPFEAEDVYSPASDALHCIIIANAGFVTTDALAWLSREHVALLIIRDGSFLTMMDAPSGRLARRELEFRRRQMECVLSLKRRLGVARSLVALKFETYRVTAIGRYIPSLPAKFTKARSIEAIMALEAEAGATYWRSWKGRQLTFTDGTFILFTARARSWRTGRMGETGKQFSNRFALDPFNFYFLGVFFSAKFPTLLFPHLSGQHQRALGHTFPDKGSILTGERHPFVFSRRRHKHDPAKRRLDKSDRMPIPPASRIRGPR